MKKSRIWNVTIVYCKSGTIFFLLFSFWPTSTARCCDGDPREFEDDNRIIKIPFSGFARTRSCIMGQKKRKVISQWNHRCQTRERNAEIHSSCADKTPNRCVHLCHGCVYCDAFSHLQQSTSSDQPTSVWRSVVDAGKFDLTHVIFTFLLNDSGSDSIIINVLTGDAWLEIT